MPRHRGDSDSLSPPSQADACAGCEIRSRSCRTLTNDLIGKVDAVIDTVGGAALTRAFDVVRTGGDLISARRGDRFGPSLTARNASAGG
jgi:hypothetical protein